MGVLTLFDETRVYYNRGLLSTKLRSYNSSLYCTGGNLTTRRPPDDRKETQTAVVWLCLPSIRSGQNHLARNSEGRKKTRQTKEEVGRQHQGMDRPAVRQVPEGSGEQGKMEKTGCKMICGAPTTFTVKGLMMMTIMMMMMMMYCAVAESACKV